MVVIMKDFVPDEYFLSQNYPDPFNEKTTIKYCLPEKVRIKLELFDSERRKVKTLIDEIKEAGTYEVEFKANGLDSGEYLYKLETTEYSDSKKMIVLK